MLIKLSLTNHSLLERACPHQRTQQEEHMSIVVAYRDSTSGRDALMLGARLASITADELHVVSVIAPAEDAKGAAGFEARRQKTQDALDDVGALVPGGPSVRVHLVVDPSVPAGLLTAAHDLDARVIVIGTARNSLLSRFSLGSVSNVLLHSADVALALAPDNAREIGPAAPLVRVTVAVGDLGGNRSMFDTATLLAQPQDTPVRLLTFKTVPTLGEDALQRARHTLDTAAIERLPEHLRVTTQVEVAGQVDRAVDQVDWDPGEIALIGSSRLAQTRRTFLGSTAGKLVRTLPIPMIIVPRDGQIRQG
ncbi:universal stress protein [Pseudoclavibacter sp. 13-3]|uniref:universal stress protein n=1 Tax=Pseudoclavibacter sp. 13-3 TaxID=2901228 RepID=UPI001E4C0DEE|nr:universal stress protein [Pseudoclavibacter sp. 13-3]MCD7101318.1 universal stress protein [Pseudoclavibacter sp. 13-3]